VNARYASRDGERLLSPRYTNVSVQVPALQTGAAADEPTSNVSMELTRFR
jgi:hypothetical protein